MKFTEVKATPPKPKEPTWHTVFLFRAPDCIRGWLAYKANTGSEPTLTVKVLAMDGAKAKNKAITAANKNFLFGDVKIVHINWQNGMWAAKHFPILHDFLEANIGDLMSDDAQAADKEIVL